MKLTSETGLDCENEVINYFVAKKIPNVKLTIVSATANELLYKNVCKDRVVRMYEVSIAKYKGKLKQYSFHPMSRSNMEQIGLE